MAAYYSSDANACRSNTSHGKAIRIMMDALALLGGTSFDVRAATLMLQGVALATSANLEYNQEAIHLSVVETTNGTLENEWLRDNPMITNRQGKKGQFTQKSFPLSDYTFIEDSDEQQGIPSSSTSAKKATRDDDLLFAIMCFFTDLNRLRTYSENLWKNVEPLGNVSRITAAFVSNEAVNVARNLEFEVSRSHVRYLD